MPAWYDWLVLSSCDSRRTFVASGVGDFQLNSLPASMIRRQRGLNGFEEPCELFVFVVSGPQVWLPLIYNIPQGLES